MVTTNRIFRRTIIKLSVAAFTFASIGAAVAAPLFQKSVFAKSEVGQLESLATGPAIQLAKAGPGESEDCVRVTSVTGPDGKQYPTFGTICGGAQ